MSKATLSASFPEEAYPLLVRTWMEWRLRRPSRDEERDRQRARELTYDAMEAPTTARALRLVRQALDLDPSNVDALQMLLDLSQVEGPERIQLLKTIVAIGAVDLGEEAFKKLVPHFWGFMETRPYMRARASLALALREAGQLEESALEYYAMLDLNPNDNQGMRYELLAVLFMLGRLKDARLLMSAYEKEYDYSVIWAWGRVLERALSPKAAGAAEALQAARKQNPHVEPFVRGHCPLPKEIPSSYSPGSLEEAQCYAQPLRQSWEAHPKALAWLTDQPEVG